ncbi:hypothetical protein Y032_0142g2326 [Ancylostoma ceylanicum]|uniref:Uncharacterized protein n=1 Tax=Ancylostoma ceylanicum TaxID=53326 RepID=A0A016T3Q7_9BILA|nr:hypothetical protein Y032_0142g2326 [Ancylostoma ceylanicum]
MHTVAFKLDCNVAVGEMLWEVYEMIEENPGMEQSRAEYQYRRRPSGRPFHREITRVIIQEEERLVELLSEALKLKVEAFVEEPSYNLLTIGSYRGFDARPRPSRSRGS